MFKLQHFAISWSTWEPPKMLQNYVKKFEEWEGNALKHANKLITHWCLKSKGNFAFEFILYEQCKRVLHWWKEICAIHKFGDKRDIFRENRIQWNLFFLLIIGFGYKSTICNVNAKMDYLDTFKCIFFCKKKHMNQDKWQKYKKKMI